MIIGASRGLGLAIAAEFLRREWNVVATVRAGSGQTPLHELAEGNPGRLDIETLDINEPDQIAALRGRLAGRSVGDRAPPGGHPAGQAESAGPGVPRPLRQNGPMVITASAFG